MKMAESSPKRQKTLLEKVKLLLMMCFTEAVWLLLSMDHHFFRSDCQSSAGEAMHNGDYSDLYVGRIHISQ